MSERAPKRARQASNGGEALTDALEQAHRPHLRQETLSQLGERHCHWHCRYRCPHSDEEKRVSRVEDGEIRVYAGLDVRDKVLDVGGLHAEGRDGPVGRRNYAEHVHARRAQAEKVSARVRVRDVGDHFQLDARRVAAARRAALELVIVLVALAVAHH